MGEVVRVDHPNLSGPVVGMASAKNHVAAEESACIELLAHVALELTALDVGVGVFQFPEAGVSREADGEVWDALGEFIFMPQREGVGQFGMEVSDELTAHGGFSHSRPTWHPSRHPTAVARSCRGFGC